MKVEVSTEIMHIDFNRRIMYFRCSQVEEIGSTMADYIGGIVLNIKSHQTGKILEFRCEKDSYVRSGFSHWIFVCPELSDWQLILNRG